VDGHALWPGPGEWLPASVRIPTQSDYTIVCPKNQPLAMLRSSTATAPMVFVGDMHPVATAQYLAARTGLLKDRDSSHWPPEG
jgi:hypothetical protein